MPKKKSKINTGAVAGYIRKSNLIWPPGCTTLEARTAFVDELRRTRVSELVTDAAARGQTIDVWYDDMGISGTGEFLEKRLAFDQLRRDAQAGKVRCLYARDLSRLFRDLVQQELWFAEMDEAGVEVCIQDLPFIADPATRTLLRQNVGAINQYFATRQGEVIRATNTERVRSGQWVGLGRSLWGLAYNPRTKHFDLDPVTAPYVQRLFSLYLHFGGVATRVVRHLNTLIQTGDAQALRSPGGCAWSTRPLLHLLRNPVYRRRARYGELEIDAPHMIPEVVVPALVAEVDRMLAQRAASPDPTVMRLQALPPRSGRVDTTYGPLLRCAFCGGRLRVRKSAPRSGDVQETAVSAQEAGDAQRWTWFCRTADWHKKDCPQSAGFRESRLDALVRRGLAEVFRRAAAPEHGGLSGKGLAEAQRARPRLTPPAPPEKGDLEVALADVEEQQRRCYDLFIGGLVTNMEELRPQMTNLASRKQLLLEQIAAQHGGAPLPSPSALPRLSAADWRRLATQFEAVWPEAQDGAILQEAKHALLRALGAFIHAGAGGDSVPEAQEWMCDGRKKSRFGGPLSIRLELAMLGYTGAQALLLAETAEEYADARRARFLGGHNSWRGRGAYRTPAERKGRAEE